MRERICIIGGGISGLTAAYLLYKKYDIQLFEANDYIGGHANTKLVEHEGQKYPVDTGFIVYNEITYPNFNKIIKSLGVESQPAPMTFSVKSAISGLEYNPHSIRTLFAQKRNILNPSFYKMLWEIYRFRSDFEYLVKNSSENSELVSTLRRRGYSEMFLDNFLIPMASSLWSTPPEEAGTFSLKTFIDFFNNHGLISVLQPIEWRTISGGSREYVRRLIEPFIESIHTGKSVVQVRRNNDGVKVICANGMSSDFDRVLFAVHSNQALEMIEHPTSSETEILSAIPYQENEVVLHTDTKVLPEHQSIWASWNYWIPTEHDTKATITYDMNLLQTIEAPVEFCVSLNQTSMLNPEKLLSKYSYEHPLYKPEAPKAQSKHAEINGKNRSYYAGAYWSYGFHEDGVSSALRACEPLGCTL